MQKILDVHLVNLEGYLQAVGPYIQIIQMGDDLGAQNAPQISPDLYRTLVKPYHKKLYDYVKNNSDLYLFMHSCGSVYDLIPDFIDTGVDILNPVQFSAAKMDSRRLKSEFGNKITCDERHAMIISTPEHFHLPGKEEEFIYLLAKENFHFVTPHTFEKYKDNYKSSFYYGGLSMEEIIVPFAILRAR